MIVCLLVSLTAMPTLGQTTWQGTTSDWNTPTNWSAGVPNAGVNVIIPNVTPSPIVSTTAVANSVEVQGGASLTITSAGSLTISGSKSVDFNYAALSNNGTVQNSGQLVIATTGGIREYGIRNSGTFKNNTGGSITIDNASQSISAGVYNKTGTFTNTGRIAIGGTATVGPYGIFNNATFNNDPGGELSIDNASSFGLYNGGGTFTNKARITIGTTAGVGQAGISIAEGSVTNTGCDAIIISNYRIDGNGSGYGSGSFTNSGTIIENSGGDSYIHTNSGLVQNLNGGTFTIPTNTGVLTTSAGLFWTGCTSTDWHTATNWSRSIVPLATDDVVIRSGVANQPVISTTAVANSVEVQNTASLTITAGGSLTINGSKAGSPYSVAFLNGGTVSNSGQLVIGNTGSVGEVGLFNRGGGGGLGFTNNAGASIQINRSSYAGVYNTSTFNNAGTITIGATASVGNYGVYSSGGFYNNTSGIITIDRSSDTGFQNSGGLSTNAGSIIIGALGSVGSVGFRNSGAVNAMTNSGTITIDRTSTRAFENNHTYTNTGIITIGALGPVGDYAIYNANRTFNNEGCGALINILADATVTYEHYLDPFNNSNGATIIERASGTSTIHNNSGLVRNLNGGTFTVANTNTGVLITAAGGITANPSLTITQGQSTTLTAEGDGPYTWSSGQSTASIEVTTSGPYSVTSTLVGCTRVSSVTVTVNPAPLTLDGLTANPSTVCVGSPVTFTATVGIASGSYAYTLTNGSTTSSGTSSNTAFSQTVTSSGSSIQSFTLTVSSNGQSTTATSGLTVNGLPTVSIAANPSLTIVQGQSTTLTASGADSYLWSTTETSAGISVTAAGPYSVTGTTSGCSSSTTVTVTVLNPATATLSGSTTLCPGQPATLSVALTGTQPWSLTYTDGTTPVNLSGITSSPHTFTVNPVNTTTYTLLAVAIDEAPTNGVVSGSAIVTRNTVASAPTLTPSSQSVIQNTPYVTLTISGCPGALNWSGSNATSGTGTVINVPTSATATIVYSATCVSSCPTPPGSATVTITQPTTTGNFDGFVNGADCGTFRGWAWDRNKINTAVSIQILDGPNVIGTLLAGDFRQDLLDAGKGNGKHAFRFTIPDNIKDGLAHTLSARIAESSFILKDSPKTLICQGGTTPPANKPPVAPTPTVLIAPLAAQVNVPFSGTLVAFTDPEGGALTYDLIGLPNGLSISTTSRVISGTPTVSGDFVLTYTATDPQLATNSVSFVLTVSAPQTTTVTGSFEGYLDKVECGTIRGWVWDRNKPNTPVTVEFYTGTTVWGSTVANIYRDDLKNAGKGNGAHAYSFEVPTALKDGNTRIIYGRVQGSTFVLKDSGKPLTCNSTTRLSAETASDLQVTVLGNPVSGQSIAVEIRGAEGQPLRLQLTDATGREVSTRQVNQAKTVEHQTIPVLYQPAGLLLLRATSGAHSVTLKILKQ